MSDVVKPLYDALSTLIGPGSIQDRMRSVGITLTPVRPFEFPPGLSERYASIRERLGTMGVAARALSDDDAGQVAAEIFSLFLKLNGGRFGGP